MGGDPKPPEIRTIQPAALPKVAPKPSPLPTVSTPLRTAEARRKRIAQARFGILSTIKTSPMGIVGAGAELGPGRGGRTFGGA